ncbi:sigma-70 family RNA polymerase sigma factor [Actinomadura bangladeshensis]|uniref:RNA polymerase sigma factor n=1 Tax=Actinomadura bangladeshensis TaxID=453573 RepID=UPI00267C5956
MGETVVAPYREQRRPRADGVPPGEVPSGEVPPGDDWVARLSAAGPVRDDAVAHLHGLMLRAARYQVGRMVEAADLGAARREEIVQAAADEATVSVLSRLHTFEGRSRFTTWAYKFGILHAGVEVRRAAWNGREIRLHEAPEPGEPAASSPEAYAEGRDLARAARDALIAALTPHQRRIAVALLVDEVPIDVLAERLGTNRSALYKTLHDARKRLRAHLSAQGYLPVRTTEEVNR